MTESRWAILKCKFFDDTSDTLPDDLYENIFTGTMVSFFQDMSHGQLDLSRSQVFGWFTLSQRMHDYRGNVPDSALNPGQLNRGNLFAACRGAAESAGVRLGDFDGVVVTMNRGEPRPGGYPGVDVWDNPGDMAVFCDQYSLGLGYLGHVMGHAYGLKHPRVAGLMADGIDRWDIMSEYHATPPYQAFRWLKYRAGGLSAANMKLKGWLDEHRVWRPDLMGANATIRLRPLHKYDLSGFLAAELPNLHSPDGPRWLLEFHTEGGWYPDSPRHVPLPAVLIHYLDEGEGISCLVPGPIPGRQHLLAGDVISVGDPRYAYREIKVLAIDELNETCDLRFISREPNPWDWIVGQESGQLLGSAPVDGDGLLVRPDGGVVPIGPWDPTFNIPKK